MDSITLQVTALVRLLNTTLNQEFIFKSGEDLKEFKHRRFVNHGQGEDTWSKEEDIHSSLSIDGVKVVNNEAFYPIPAPRLC